jgi:hypothetical protein
MQSFAPDAVDALKTFLLKEEETSISKLRQEVSELEKKSDAYDKALKFLKAGDQQEKDISNQLRVLADCFRKKYDDRYTELVDMIAATNSVSLLSKLRVLARKFNVFYWESGAIEALFRDNLEARRILYRDIYNQDLPSDEVVKKWNMKNDWRKFSPAALYEAVEVLYNAKSPAILDLLKYLSETSGVSKNTDPFAVTPIDLSHDGVTRVLAAIRNTKAGYLRSRNLLYLALERELESGRIPRSKESDRLLELVAGTLKNFSSVLDPLVLSDIEILARSVFPLVPDSDLI